MARASTRTLLSLDTYAEIMGIAPPHFNQGEAPPKFKLEASCNDIWFQYDWQNDDRVSREQLARHIYDAEQDIARALGFHPAPVWVKNESHPLPRYHRREFFAGAQNIRGGFQSLQTKFGKVIAGGIRATTFVFTATVGGGELVYSDDDGDGFAETATITVTTVETDVCQLKAYFPGKAGRQEWEIRPARDKTLIGGVLTMKFFTWQLADYKLWEEFPVGGDDGLKAIDFSQIANLQASADVYREFNDNTQPASQFFESNDICHCLLATCTICAQTSVSGCMGVRNGLLGSVLPVPANFVNGAWSIATGCNGVFDRVKLSYYGGHLPDDSQSCYPCEDLEDYLAHAIAWLATARLDRPLCSCSNVKAKADNLQVDLAKIEARRTSFLVDQEVLKNPFGTKLGEFKAWRRISRLIDEVPSVAVI